MSQRQHLIQAGQVIDEPEPPEALSHVWSWFWELDSVRGSNGFGPNPISYLEIDAWARITGTVIDPAEVRIIKAMDGVRLDAKP